MICTQSRMLVIGGQLKGDYRCIDEYIQHILCHLMKQLYCLLVVILTALNFFKKVFKINPNILKVVVLPLC